jgi:hypothetical protein
MLLALRHSRRTRRAGNRLPPHLTDRPKANQWVIPRHSLQSAAMAVDALGLCRGRHSDGAAEGRGRGDGAGASWGLGASRESCCSGEGHWVGRTDLCCLLEREEDHGDNGGRRTIMQWMPVVVVASEQPWQSTPVYTVLLLAGGQQPACLEMKVVQSVELEAAAEMAKSQAAEARKRRMLMMLAVLL